MLLAIKKFNTALTKVERVLMLILSAIVVISMVTQVVCRYALYIATPWAEEVALFAFMWACWIGSAYAVSTNDHLSISVIDSLFNTIKDEKKRALAFRIVSILADLFSLGFLIFFTILYSRYFLTLAKHPQLSPVMHLPMPYIQATGLVGGALMSIHMIINLVFNLVPNQN